MEPEKDKKEETHEKKGHSRNITNKIRENPWIVSTIVLGIFVLLLIIFGFSGITGKAITAKGAGEKLLNFYEEMGAEGLEVDSVREISGLYQVIFEYKGDLIPFYITKDGKLAGSLSALPTSDSGSETQLSENQRVTDSTFLDTGDEICKDSNGKPYVLLFSTTWCPHCEWIADTFDGLKKESFAGKINLQHWEIDIGDNTLTSKIEEEVPEDVLNLYEEYNPRGSIPTYIFGCKYMRVGNGYEQENDLNAELKDFRFIINKLLE